MNAVGAAVGTSVGESVELDVGAVVGVGLNCRAFHVAPCEVMRFTLLPLHAGDDTGVAVAPVATSARRVSAEANFMYRTSPGVAGSTGAPKDATMLAVRSTVQKRSSATLRPQHTVGSEGHMLSGRFPRRDRRRA